MTKYCPTVYYDDLVRWNGMRGIVEREWSAYDPTGEHDGKYLILFEGGQKEWLNPNETERLHEQFLGMPNEDHAPEFMNPLTLWQQIPHEYNEYLTWDMDSGCMYCGLPESNVIHLNNEERV